MKPVKMSFKAMVFSAALGVCSALAASANEPVPVGEGGGPVSQASSKAERAIAKVFSEGAVSSESAAARLPAAPPSAKAAAARLPPEPGSKRLAVLNAALLEEVQRGNLEDAGLLLGEGAQAFAKQDDGTTALIIAARNNDTAMAELLLRHKASLDSRNDGHETALLVAAGKKAAEMTRLLLAHHASPDRPGSEETGKTPLMAAAQEKGSPEIVSLLLKAGADPARADSNGDTALIFAANNSDSQTAVKMIEALMTQGARPADVKHQNHRGKTALFYAAVNGDAPAARKLLDYGADPTVKDEEDETILMAAALSGSTDTARLVLASSDVNAKTTGYHPRTALAYAVDDRHADMAQFLLDHGADKNVVWWPPFDIGGYMHMDYNALMVAAEMCDRATMKVLLDAGADFNYKNASTFTPLSVARFEASGCGANDTTDLLKAAGAKE